MSNNISCVSFGCVYFANFLFLFLNTSLFHWYTSLSCQLLLILHLYKIRMYLYDLFIFKHVFPLHFLPLRGCLNANKYGVCYSILKKSVTDNISKSSCQWHMLSLTVIGNVNFCLSFLMNDHLFQFLSILAKRRTL